MDLFLIRCVLTKMGWWKLSCFATVLVCVLAICRGGEASVEVRYDEHQPLSRVSLHTARVMLDESVSISASPEILGRKVLTLPSFYPLAILFVVCCFDSHVNPRASGIGNRHCIVAI